MREWQAREFKRALENADAAAAHKHAEREKLKKAHADAARQRDLNVAARARMAAAAVAGGRGGTNPATALADALRDQHQHQHHQRHHPQQQVQQQPAVRQHLPAGVDASAANVATVHDAHGNVAGYRVWSSAAEMQQQQRQHQHQQQQAVPFVGAGGSPGVGRTSAGGVAGRVLNGLGSSSSGGSGGGGAAAPAAPAARPSRGMSMAEVASMSDDGIMLRHVRGGVLAVGLWGLSFQCVHWRCLFVRSVWKVVFVPCSSRRHAPVSASRNEVFLRRVTKLARWFLSLTSSLSTFTHHYALRQDIVLGNSPREQFIAPLPIAAHTNNLRPHSYHTYHTPDAPRHFPHSRAQTCSL